MRVGSSAVIVVSAWLAVSVATAHAGYFLTGAKLAEDLRAEDRINNATQSGADFSLAANASGYIMGVYDVAAGVSFCSPSHLTVGQVVALVKKYLDTNPEHWNEPASDLVLDALRKAYPCKRGETQKKQSETQRHSHPKDD